jgi:hypothetical protein
MLNNALPKNLHALILRASYHNASALSYKSLCAESDLYLMHKLKKLIGFAL